MIIGSKIFHKNEIYNSLEWAEKNIDMAPDGSVFLANIHKKTKGRQNKTWYFDKGQLAVTILLKNKKFQNIQTKNLSLRLNQLSMAIILGIQNPLKKFQIKLKWPNDLYFEKKKLGGILTKTIWSGNNIKGIIVGFAININNKPPKLEHKYYQSVSLYNITGKRANKNILLKEILFSINIFYMKWLNSDFNEIFLEWKRNQINLNKNITILKKDKSISKGILINFLENGDLLLKKETEVLQLPFCLIENLY